jgi:CheY-like chemotaxis protein
MAIIDYQMPGMDGAALAAAIKDDPTTRDTLVVMLTSVSKSTDARHAAGCDAYLVKPVRSSALLHTLATTWAKLRGANPAINCAPVQHAPDWPIATRRRNGPPIRILVADDNSVNQTVAVRMLAKLGLRADVAADGREAVDLFAALPYDLVLMDCQMPGMDGYEATREIRKHESRGRHVVIIAMTAGAMAEDRARCLNAGMDDYIAKPLGLQDLAAVLDRSLTVDAVG